jgi:hypothetical protein
MFRKFVYESFTTAYDTTASQGYASCGSTIAWQDDTTVAGYATYQNYSAWMSTYSAGSSSNPCIATTMCGYGTTTSGGTTYKTIPYSAPPAAANTNSAGCFQAAAMAVSDIMYALSYIASCQYIKTFAVLTAVNAGGACFDLGDGLVYLTAAQGLCGFGFILVTIVAALGTRRFDTDHYDDGKSEEASGKKDDVDGPAVPMEPVYKPTAPPS